MLGLAISLVSTVPEKVWYCKVKGYKPWLNPKQQDVLDNEQGGHTTWYDEPALLKVCPAFPTCALHDSKKHQLCA